MIDLISVLLLCASIALSTGRNLLSKNISDEKMGTRKFFGFQTLIFFSGALFLFFINIGSSWHISPLTICFSLIYGSLLMSAQWNYTVALRNGKTGICSTVYSLGFILPTAFGSLTFQEPFSLWDGFGIAAVILAIILTSTKKENETQISSRYFIPLIIAMLCSGGLGIMQKIQQNSAYANEKNCFILLSFSFAALCSFVCFWFGTEKENVKFNKKSFSSIGIGIAFASCNLLNTILSGRLPSAVFFPALNVGTILFSLVLGVLCFQEKPTKKDAFIFSLGVLSILLITIS
jgi:drug/metabolite transporter (DMT)-like permease